MQFPSDTELERLQKPLRDALNELYMDGYINISEFQEAHKSLDSIDKLLEEFYD